MNQEIRHPTIRVTQSTALYSLSCGLLEACITSGLFIDIELGMVYSKIDIDITNVHGQLLRSLEFKEVNEVKLSIDEAPGLYFLNVKTAEGARVFRVVKE